MDEDTPQLPPTEEKSSGVGGLIAALAILTIAGGLAGGAFGFMQQGKIDTLVAERVAKEPATVPTALAFSEETAIADLDPVVANLAEPSTTWVRVEGAVVFDTDAVEDVPRLRAMVEQSILQFIRTLSIGELTGASAFLHLHDDLSARIKTETEGAVRELLIESLVLQ